MGSTSTRETSPRDAGSIVESFGLPADPLVAERGDPVPEHVRVGLDKRLRTLVAHDRGTRLGTDPEDLHQMRVSVRRMRAVLKSGRAFLDQDWSEPLRGELGWLGRSLGPVRDLDVLLEELRREATGFGADERATADRLISGLEAERARARVDVLAALDSERYTDLLAALTEAARTPLPTSSSEVDSREALGELVNSQFGKLRKSVQRDGPNPDDAQLHALRIRGKRLRYTAELAAPLFGKRMDNLLKAAKRFQDVLGQHQDASFAEGRIRELLRGGTAPDADVTFVAGRMVERQAARRAESRARWWSCWKELDQRAKKL